MARHGVTLFAGKDVDLARTMDIQIPALTWVPAGVAYVRDFYVDRRALRVRAQSYDGGVRLSWESDTHLRNAAIERMIRAMFIGEMRKIRLPQNQALRQLQEYYSGVILMRVPLVEALVVTILSQNKTGEQARDAFMKMNTGLRGITAQALVQATHERLRELARKAGPYKAGYLKAVGKFVLDRGEDQLRSHLTGDTVGALHSLLGVKGIGHKTAACVLVFFAGKQDIVPVDTHLWRVGSRLGLWAGSNGKKEELVQRSFVHRNTDSGSAHLLLVLLGRDKCHARQPKCEHCPVRLVCPATRVEDRVHGGRL